MRKLQVVGPRNACQSGIGRLNTHVTAIASTGRSATAAMISGSGTTSGATGAIRDEGTSYHYLPASREVGPTPRVLAAILATLTEREVPFVSGKTWTTDAIFRETRSKAARRVAEGCICVEMEAAACFAVAAFRDVGFGQMLYAGDDLSGEIWDDRGWVGHATGREALFRLAVDAITSIEV